MNQDQPNNPLHGLTLANILQQLVDHFGWERLGAVINIRCFNHAPSIKSSLKFLRRTPWARTKVEQLYIDELTSFSASKRTAKKSQKRPTNSPVQPNKNHNTGAAEVPYEGYPWKI